MEFLVTLIGNAAVDPHFRQSFLNDPELTIEQYGFRLTKGEYELMMEVFGNLTPQQKEGLELAFANLEDKLYLTLRLRIPPCNPPCFWSIHQGVTSAVALRKAG